MSQIASLDTFGLLAAVLDMGVRSIHPIQNQTYPRHPSLESSSHRERLVWASRNPSLVGRAVLSSV